MLYQTPFYKGILILLILSFGLSAEVCSQGSNETERQKVFTFDTLLMGSAFSFSAIHTHTDSSFLAVRAAIEEVIKIERLISSWSPTSETSKINSNAGIRAVNVSPELYQLIRRSVKVSKLSKGAFDITFRPTSHIWQFDKSEKTLPDSSLICEALNHIGFRHIQLLPQNRVYLNDSSVQIGFGAIGKGYAANRARRVMEQYGISGGLINAGGDILSFGEGPQNGEWPVVVSNPLLPSEFIAKVSVSGLAVVTSGDYEKYFVSDGVRYPHIIDPRTGWPAVGLRSVTVFCPDAELADALSTAVFVLGAEPGISIINELMMVECFIIDDKGNQYYSEGLSKNKY